LNGLLTKMYPIVKGNGGKGGEVSTTVSKHILLQFNCLGTETTEEVILVIPS